MRNYALMQRSLYNDRRWRTCRALYLRKHPLCRLCLALGVYRAAAVVDHIVPHKGSRALFWSQSNWQALCRSCQESHKKMLERGGRMLPDSSWGGVDDGTR